MATLDQEGRWEDHSAKAIGSLSRGENGSIGAFWWKQPHCPRWAQVSWNGTVVSDPLWKGLGQTSTKLTCSHM